MTLHLSDFSVSLTKKFECLHISYTAYNKAVDSNGMMLKQVL